MTRAEDIVIPHDGRDIRLSAKLRLTNDHLVIFLHGFGCTKESFNSGFKARGLRDFSLCSFDFPGHGASSRTDVALYSLQSYADITNQVVDRLSPSRVSIVGHSMGGAVGLLAAQSCRSLAAFVNVEGNLVEQDCDIVSRGTANQSLDAFRQRGYGEFLQNLRSSKRADLHTWARWYAQADPAALHEMACSLVEWSDSGKLLDLLKSLKTKSYVYGARDPKPYLVPQLTDVPTFPIADSGHFVMRDNPAAFYRLLPELLRLGYEAKAPVVHSGSTYPMARVPSRT
jgi:pimeloyl-ACP methyl ester carboxylesterase